jgi:predicted ATPase/class 3 adenylate cyclase
MTNQSETFGRLLRGAINSIAAYEGKAAAAVEEELGAAIGLSGATIQRYKNGTLPPEARTVQILAEAAVRRGYLGRAWLQRFLQAARHPNPDTLLAQLADTPTTMPLPGGTLIFLFTDVEGSTQLWERDRAAMERALVRHDEIMRQAVDAYGGHVFKTVGDAFYAAFVTATDALDAAIAAQRTIGAETWSDATPIRVRMALHAGAAQQRDGDYFGPPLNRVARLCATGHGGQVLLSAAAWELARDQLPPGMTLRDLGEHRLKDLARHEHVFQIAAPGLPTEFPPLRALDRYRHNLPAQATLLIGREVEVLAVRDMLRQPATHLLTLTGPGGVGKTRLALQAAAELLDDFRDGVFFVALAAIRDPQLIAPAIARELGMADAGELPLVERLKRYLHTKQLLLVLDNFEQVADAAPLVAELLAAAPELKALVTSREALHVYGEREYAVPPLALPDLTQLLSLARLSQYEAVRLFIERARAVKTDFALTDASAPAIAEICARLDGLPLAIELAAARSRIFTPQALLARLVGSKRRLALLSGGARDLPMRQQTLRDAIAWSYDLLDVREQALFARLSVFAGGFTLDATEAVCGDTPLAELMATLADDDAGLRELRDWAQQSPTWQVALATEEIAALLESLASKSLVRQVEIGEAPRFTVLETIREYALECLAESGEEQAVRWRHAGYYAWLHGSTDVWTHPRGVAVIEDELDNLRTTLGWCVETGDVVPGLVIGSDFTFWAERANQGRRWLAALLAWTVSVSHATAGAWYCAAALAVFNHDYSVARAGIETYYRMVGDLGEPTHLKFWNLGFVALGEGDIPSAGALFEQFLANEHATLNREDIAWGHVGLGAYHLMSGNQVEAQAEYEKSLAVFRSADQSMPVTDILHNLGFAAQTQGNLSNAVSYFRESIELARPRRYRRAIAANLYGLAGVAIERGELERAAQLFGTAEILSEMTSGQDIQERYVTNRNIALLREQLDPATLEAHWAEGRALDWEQAVEEALAFAETV